MSVAKARAQRHFVLAAGRVAQEVPLRDPSRRGFSLELTRLRRGAANHWTFGIEAAPDDPTLLGDLLPALRDALRGFPLTLPQTHALSYPAWLAG